MDAFEHLLELSMSIPGCATDPHALREAHAAMKALNDDCGPVTVLWPTSGRAPRASKIVPRAPVEPRHVVTEDVAAGQVPRVRRGRRVLSSGVAP